MPKKCTKKKHFPDWDDHEVTEVNGKEIRIECNCECWKESFMRVYFLDGEYQLKGNKYILR